MILVWEELNLEQRIHAQAAGIRGQWFTHSIPDNDNNFFLSKVCEG